ncbi:(S)-benzoin forming benzil reductase [Peribacillus sp. NPDC097675]|uniref:(S)-benzoin forming benzil reductase n=1 Tax=Peribacillus sp. NPDC097675 TaxID=3390618 RepID=UPI003CFFDA1F
MKTFIITGASRGLGAAIAEQCLNKGDHCILISRIPHPELAEKAVMAGAKLSFIYMDLFDGSQLLPLIDKILTELDEESDIYFINNAGVIDPIKTVGNLEQENIEVSMRVNFMAPVVLADAFINRTKDWKQKKVMVNISSGAAKNSYHGWAAYCSTKAGLEMFTRVAGLEQEKESYPMTLISFSPGVMDTQMQETIRSADEKDFSDRSKFHAYKDKGLLRSPEFVAEKLLHLLEHTDLENGKFYELNRIL